MMKTTKQICGMALFFLLIGGGGYAEGANGIPELSLVNTVTLSLGEVENLSINYADDEVILRESGSEELIIREYMKKDRPQYHARVSRSGESVSVRRGRRPWLPWSRKARIEIELPRSFREHIKISHAGGTFRAETDLKNYKTIDVSSDSGSISFKDLSAETVSVRVSSGSLDVGEIGDNSFISISSGRLRIGALTGGEHRIKVSSGRAAIERLQGRVELHASSGSLTMGQFSGEGSFDISSGNITLDTRELTGDLRLTVSSGSVSVSVPREFPFNLDAVTSGGRVLVNEAGRETARVPGNSTVLRPFGSSPVRTIYARTGSGTLTINRDL